MKTNRIRRFIEVSRRLAHAPHGLTRIPSTTDSVTSDLFLWRRDAGWVTTFELLDIVGLINPDKHAPRRHVKLVVFNARGDQVADERVNVEPNVRHTLEVLKYVPASAGDYGTFACFHEGINQGLAPDSTFIAERGYCGYALGPNDPRSFVHGNLDAVAWGPRGLELLGTQGLVASRYQLQLVIESDGLFELAVVNPSNSWISLKFLQQGRDGEEVSRVRLAPKASFIKTVGADRIFDSTVTIKSRLPMARPQVFFRRGSHFDVFHG